MPGDGVVTEILEDAQDAAGCLCLLTHLPSSGDRDRQRFLGEQVLVMMERFCRDPMVQRVNGEIIEDPVINLNNDGNTVDMEREMARLAENTILYRTAVELINKKLGSLKYAIQGGNR